MSDTKTDPLKSIVIGMGVLLLLGTIALIGTAYYKFSKSEPESATQTADKQPACTPAPLNLAGYGDVREMEVAGPNLLLRFDRAIVTLDRCNGQIRGTLALTNETR